MTGNATDNQPQAQVLPLIEAARLLKVSERTIWRRIKAGKLQTIDMNGKTCVQVLQSVSVSDVSENSVSMTGNSQTMDVARVDDRLIDSLHDRIRDLKDENERLWSEIEVKQGTIDSLTKMLPAPKYAGQVSDDKPKRIIWPWIVAGVAILAAVVAVIALQPWGGY